MDYKNELGLVDVTPIYSKIKEVYDSLSIEQRNEGTIIDGIEAIITVVKEEG